MDFHVLDRSFVLTQREHRAVLEVGHGVLSCERVSPEVLHHGVFHYLLPRPKQDMARKRPDGRGERRVPKRAESREPREREGECFRLGVGYGVVLGNYRCPPYDGLRAVYHLNPSSSIASSAKKLLLFPLMGGGGTSKYGAAMFQRLANITNNVLCVCVCVRCSWFFREYPHSCVLAQNKPTLLLDNG